MCNVFLLYEVWGGGGGGGSRQVEWLLRVCYWLHKLTEDQLYVGSIPAISTPNAIQPFTSLIDLSVFLMILDIR